MSFIRQNQESEYVELHDGSMVYLYDTGRTVTGYDSYGKWIDALCEHAELAGVPDIVVDEFQRDLEDHYGEHREATSHSGPNAEMAHIIAQHLDSRLDGWEYNELWETALRKHAAKSFTECSKCGDYWRKTPYTPDFQEDRCRSCDAERLRSVNVSADMSAALEYLETEIPDDISPEQFHDEEFYAHCMNVWASASGERKNALHQQLGNASDEVMDAEIEGRPVDKDYVRQILEDINE